MDFRKARLQIILSAVIVIVFIGGIAYLSILITKNTLPEKESGGREGGYAIFSPEQKERTGEFAKEEWTTYGGDYYNRRYSELSEVNLGTIQDLKPTWATDFGTGINDDSLGEAVPIVVGDVMYVAVGSGDVVALDAKTGEKLWGYHPKIQEVKEDNCCSRATRSVAVAEGKVYVNRFDATLVALDQKTGSVIWEKEVADWQQGYRITSAPLYYNGNVYTGVTGGKDGLTGSIIAFSAEDGRDIWTFDGLPEAYNQLESSNVKGEGLHEEIDIAPVWNTPAVDSELDTIYFAASLMIDESTSKYEENQLYASLVVAVNAKTGEYKWHFQDENTEEWFVDAANPVVLFDIGEEEQKKKALGQAGKKGWVYLLDRQNGEPLFEVKKDKDTVFQWEDPKPAATQSPSIEQNEVHSTVEDEVVDGNLGNGFESRYTSAFTPFWDFPMIEPSPQYGDNWQPSAYSPKTEYYYVLGEPEKIAGISENKSAEDRMYVGNINERASSRSRQALLTAFDVQTNQIAWQVNWQPVEYTSILATAGDILFAGNSNGQVSALHAATGKEVWNYETKADSNTPAVTYEADGEQYISVLAVEGTVAGSVYRQKIYTFKLDGAWDGIANDASAIEIKE